jgi:hypothetical protein
MNLTQPPQTSRSLDTLLPSEIWTDLKTEYASLSFFRSGFLLSLWQTT